MESECQIFSLIVFIIGTTEYEKEFFADFEDLGEVSVGPPCIVGWICCFYIVDLCIEKARRFETISRCSWSFHHDSLQVCCLCCPVRCFQKNARKNAKNAIIMQSSCSHASFFFHVFEFAGRSQPPTNLPRTSRSHIPQWR